MVKEEKMNSSILAIQDLIIRARIIASEKQESDMLFNLLDSIEYLPALILEKKDNTDFFKDFLDSVCTEYNFPDIMKKYNTI
jgi:hypothetical protein